MKKNKKIQMVRGIAIIAVVLIHTCPSGKAQVYVRPFVNFAVATFLFLSGYLTNASNLDWKKIYKKRIIRVIIPYCLWTFLYTTAGFITNGIDLKKYVINLLSANAAAPLYFILVYIQLVVLTPFACLLMKSRYKWFGIAISPLFILIKYYWVVNGKEPGDIANVLYKICCLGWFMFYYLGLVLGNENIKVNFKLSNLIFLYVISIIIQIIEGDIWLRLGEMNCGTQLKLSAFFTSSIFILVCYWYFNNQKILSYSSFLCVIGDYSFGIYISHMMLILILEKVPFYSVIPFGLNSLIILAITTNCCIIGKKILGDRISCLIGLY